MGRGEGGGATAERKAKRAEAKARRYAREGRMSVEEIRERAAAAGLSLDDWVKREAEREVAELKFDLDLDLDLEPEAET